MGSPCRESSLAKGWFLSKFGESRIQHTRSPSCALFPGQRLHACCLGGQALDLGAEPGEVGPAHLAERAVLVLELVLKRTSLRFSPLPCSGRGGGEFSNFIFASLPKGFVPFHVCPWVCAIPCLSMVLGYHPLSHPRDHFVTFKRISHKVGPEAQICQNHAQVSPGQHVEGQASRSDNLRFWNPIRNPFCARNSLGLSLERIRILIH